MKHRWISILLLLAVVTITAQAQLFGGGKKNLPQVRELMGQVMNKSEAPLSNAIVYLKNTKTLKVTTFITGDDGKYRFPSLAQNVDYDIYAEHQGKRSDTKTLSSFDSRAQAHINLKIDK